MLTSIHQDSIRRSSSVTVPEVVSGAPLVFVVLVFVMVISWEDLKGSWESYRVSLEGLREFGSIVSQRGLGRPQIGLDQPSAKI